MLRTLLRQVRDELAAVGRVRLGEYGEYEVSCWLAAARVIVNEHRRWTRQGPPVAA